MQRLRSTFKRSRTPTGAEMKSQSSLEVPKQVRSASFDEIQLEVKRQDQNKDLIMKTNTTTTTSSSSSSSPARSDIKRLNTLRVPQLSSGQRSRSFDVYERTSLLSPSFKSTSSSSSSNNSSVSCYHCFCVEQYNKQFYQKSDSDDNEESENSELDLTLTGESCDEDYDDYDGTDDDQDDDDHDESCIDKREGSPEIRVTFDKVDDDQRNKSEVNDKDKNNDDDNDDNTIKVEFIPSERPRRLSRQEALTSFPIDLPSILGPDDDDDESRDDDYNDVDNNKTLLVVRDIFLAVPELKRDRAASVDSCFNNNKNGKNDGNDCLNVPQQNTRSKSVDIVLPTDQQTRYTALLPGKNDRARGEKEDAEAGGSREPRSTPDWGPDAINGEHLWVPTAASGDFCYANDCSKHGPRLKCAACRVVAHACCAINLNFQCKSSFRDVGIRQYREQTSTHHHWVHRRSQKGKCSNCSKAFQSKLSFSSKEIVAVSCSWCKSAYHNKEACFNVEKIGENCELGIHNTIVVPPSWIIKLPRKGSFKSSLRKPRKKKSSSATDGSGGGVGGSGSRSSSSRRKSKIDKDNKDATKPDPDKLWVVKPIPSPNIKPVIVFINPKSGGNQGAKLLQKFQWLLNPRQVFDLTQGGPKMGLELFKKVPNLRVLACGGDGTVGWVLSILDQIGITPSPAVGVLPLGTGNDLARALGWGGGYTDEPIGKILSNIGESDTILLDRWEVSVVKNPDANPDDDSGKGKDNLPLNVVNNYFSLGVDAHIALEFHEAREAHPERFNSRLRNKMFYGQMGGKDLVRRKWKDLSEFVTLECDGQDMTPKLKEHRVHAIVFLNIPSYGGGTHPWGAISGTKEPSTEDGLFEVVGLTTYQLPLLQAGGHGTCITQCSNARLVTTRTIPMQVDGEACRVLPSIIEIKLLNKATMLAKKRSTSKSHQNVGNKLESLILPLMRIRMVDYEAYHSDKNKLKKIAVSMTDEPLTLDATMDLESLRKLLANKYPMDSCCFLDSCTAERFFRIDRAQEQLHYITDVASEAVYILDEEPTNQSVDNDGKYPEPETAQASPSQEKAPSKLIPQSKTESREEVKKSISQEAHDTKEEQQQQQQQQLPQHKHSLDLNKKTINEYTNENRVQNQGPSKLIRNAKSTDITERESESRRHFVSARDRLFSLSNEVHLTGSGLEKPSDGIIRAAKLGDLKSLKELHQRGHSLLSIDSNGQTALHIASRHGFTDVVRYLIACAPPAILNMVDNDKGHTALHKAAQQKRRTICCMLVAGGATLTVQDRHGNTPRQLALIADDRDLAAYLHSQEQFHLDTEDLPDLP